MERKALTKVQKSPVRSSDVAKQTSRPSFAAHSLLELQRSIGNQAIQRLIESPYIQTRLRVSTPADASEQEAEHVADTVMRMPEPEPATEENQESVQTKSLASGITRLVQRAPLAVREDDDEEKVAMKADDSDSPLEKENENKVQTKSTDAAAPLIRRDDEEEEELQRQLSNAPAAVIQRMCKECEEENENQPAAMVQPKSDRPSALKPGASLDANINALNNGGSPLPETARAFFEPRFGADFSRVRVHTGSQAQETARLINARAFTVGQNIAFGTGQYAPRSQEGRRLLAHELTHVVQQGAASSALPVARYAPSSVLQRAVYLNFQGSPYLFLQIPFEDKSVGHMLTLDQEIAASFDADYGLAQRVEDSIAEIFNPPLRVLHETTAYLESPAVRSLIMRGLRSLVTTGHPNFTELSDLLSHRSDLFYQQNLLPDVTTSLAAALGIDPATIDWNVLIPALRTYGKDFDASTVINAAQRDRYDMFLQMLGNEAAVLPPVVGAAAIDVATADGQLFAYMINRGPALFTEDVLRYHSEKFIEEYLPPLEALRYVPEHFNLAAFEPAKDTTRIDAARERIIKDFIDREAVGRVVMYILDVWTVSGASPEQFLSTLNLETFREVITAQLASELIKQATSDPDLMGALRSRAFDQARYNQVALMVGYGRELERHNSRLREIFLNTPIEQLSEEDHAIAADPYVYYNTSQQISSALFGMFNTLTPNGPIEPQVVTAAASMLSALDIPAGYAPLFLLPELLGYLGALRTALEEQERKTQAALKERLDLDFERIAVVVRNAIDLADYFIEMEWIPMLKQVAIEFATRNRDELKNQDENWEAIRRSRTLDLAQGAAELEFLTQQLESGRATEIKLEGRSLRREDAPQLRKAAGVLRAAGLEQLNDSSQAEKRTKLRGAVADFDQVIEDIRDGTYDPLDYSRAVYDEARQRLGISNMGDVVFDYATVGMVLSRTVAAQNNPFLNYAIVRWHYKEGLARDFRQMAILFGLGLLSLAAAIVPGAVGVVLTAIDIGLSIYSGIEGVQDAKAVLRMARLDIHGDVVGVSEAEAEAALRHAWINLGVSILLTAGPLALRARAFLRESGGQLVPRAGRAAGLTKAEGQLLRETSALHGSQLRPRQLNAEAEIVSRTPPRPSTLSGFEEEVRIGNDHTWRRRGSTWCRFSVPFCMPDASLPTALRRRAYRDVARTLDQGIDASGRLVGNRGHSFADHGAHTTPAQHQRRLLTGVTPGGSNRGVPTNSSKFSTHRAQLDAYQMAQNDLGANYLRTSGTPKAGYSNTLTLNGVGKSYTLGPGGNLIETTANRFYFYFEKNAQGWYDLITMYPVP